MNNLPKTFEINADVSSVQQGTSHFEPENCDEKLLVSVRNVGVTYNQKRSIFKPSPFEALKKVNFDIYSGDSIGIIGRNGAGKSTLLQLIAGIIKPNKGQVIIHGATTALLSLGAGFQNELSGRDNILLSGMLLGASKEAIKEKEEAIIDFAELSSHIDVPVRTYSSGMRARLGFSLAYQLETDILLIDETLGVGDAVFRKKSSEAMRKKIKSHQTVVLVSHNPNTIKQLCTHAVWIENGTSLAFGEVEEVMNAYEKSSSGVSGEIPEKNEPGKILPKDINLIRDTALKFEKSNLEMALQYMQIAHKLRPRVVFLQEKVKEYKQKLDEAAIAEKKSAHRQMF